MIINDIFNTPILFLIFNRLDTTKQVFERIRKTAPAKLYIASDGPRDNREGEEEKVNVVRDYVLKSIDWNCEVKTLFREKNLGCGKAVSQAITWFFENEKMGIILEDDILADLSFFRLCDELLKKYKDDDRIGQIGGFNVIDKELESNEYYFSKYPQIWGWASWRRAWADYDFTISSWEKLRNTDFVYRAFSNKYFAKERIETYNKTYNSRGEYYNTWDFQWTFCNLVQNRLTIIPGCNLITNIGFNKDATHTFVKKDPRNNIQRGEIIFPLKHPVSFICDSRRDKKLVELVTPNRWVRAKRKLRLILPDSLIKLYKLLRKK